MGFVNLDSGRNNSSVGGVSSNNRVGGADSNDFASNLALGRLGRGQECPVLAKLMPIKTIK